MSLRSRIALVAAVLVLAAVFVTSLLQTVAARQAVLEQARVGGDGIAEVLARVAAFAESRKDPEGPDGANRNAVLDQLVAELVGGDIREIRIVDPRLASLVNRRVPGSSPASGDTRAALA